MAAHCPALARRASGPDSHRASPEARSRGPFSARPRPRPLDAPGTARVNDSGNRTRFAGLRCRRGREQALCLADQHTASSEHLHKAVVALADDPSPRVRFQLAFTLGEATGPDIAIALAKIIRRDVSDPWTQTAVLSSCAQLAHALLHELSGDQQFSNQATADRLQFLTRLAALIGARGQDTELASAFSLLAPKGQKIQTWQSAILTGLGQGLQNSGRPLSRFWDSCRPSSGLLWSRPRRSSRKRHGWRRMKRARFRTVSAQCSY